MKWTPGGESQDIEDRRDEGGGGGFQFGGRHIGIGGALILLILSFIFRTNLFTLLGGGTGDPGTAVSQPDPARDASEKPLVQFVSFVLDDTQKTWTQIWCFSAIALSPDAAALRRPRALSIVQAMRGFTSIWAFSMS